MATLIIIDDPLQPWERDWQRRCLERLLINAVLFRRAIQEGYRPIYAVYPISSGYYDRSATHLPASRIDPPGVGASLYRQNKHAAESLATGSGDAKPAQHHPTRAGHQAN